MTDTDKPDDKFTRSLLSKYPALGKQLSSISESGGLIVFSGEIASGKRKAAFLKTNSYLEVPMGESMSADAVLNTAPVVH